MWTGTVCKPMKNVKICPLRLLNSCLETEDGDCIAILSSAMEPDAARLPRIPYVLRIYEDLDAPIPERSFTEADAEAFARFLQSHTVAQTVYCCCDAGKSRSPAVAAAVLRYFGLDDSPIWNDPGYHPNMLVFDLLTQALGIPVSDEEKDLLIHTNRTAFRKAIQAARQ